MYLNGAGFIVLDRARSDSIRTGLETQQQKYLPSDDACQSRSGKTAPELHGNTAKACTLFSLRA
jgi:hypothetical protein